jgi:ABC-type enterobactin transport system permease subunit
MTNVQSALNLAAGAPLLAVTVAVVALRKFTKLVKRLVLVGIVCGAVLVVNNAQLAPH